MNKEEKNSKVYKSPKVGQPLITTISSSCVTPKLEVKFSSIFNPFYYPNSPKVPRYSVTCLVDPKKNSDFLLGIETIEKNEGVDSVIKTDCCRKDGENMQSGKVTVKFQTKDLIPIFIKDGEQAQSVIMEGEFDKGDKIEVVYDILRYTKRNTTKTEHGITFKPTAIYYYPSN